MLNMPLSWKRKGWEGPWMSCQQASDYFTWRAEAIFFQTVIKNQELKLLSYNQHFKKLSKRERSQNISYMRVISVSWNFSFRYMYIWNYIYSGFWRKMYFLLSGVIKGFESYCSDKSHRNLITRERIDTKWKVIH